MAETSEIERAFKAICSMEAPLGERLAAFSAVVRAHALPFAEAYDHVVARVRSGEAGAAAPKPGDSMLAFPDRAGRVHRLDEMLPRGPVVVSFNRGHWCEYCAIELSALRQALGEIAATGATVVSIMPETREFIAKVAPGGKSFLVLSDENNGYALALNLVIWLGERVRALYLLHGIRLDLYQGNDGWFVPIPATFVVRRDGDIAARFVDPDFRRRMEHGDLRNPSHTQFFAELIA
ncbi:MAG TPA: peroxiredoxin-like family protein [Hyphomicrobiaceae bacterium]|nr:peroxiredoxin-like family protein [Hyphomicrobiaceae bacterium]